MDTFQSRIKKYRKDYKLSQSKLGSIIGATGSAVSNWEVGLSFPERKYIEAMAEYFNIPAQELQYGTIEEKQVNTHIYYIPYLTVKATASFIETVASENYQLNERFPVYYSANETPKPNQIVVEVEGESMEPTINSGSKILVEEVSLNDLVYINSGIYSIVFDSKFCVKRIKENELLTKGYLTLYSDNTKSGHFTVERHNIRAVWRAIRIVDQKL